MLKRLPVPRAVFHYICFIFHSSNTRGDNSTLNIYIIIFSIVTLLHVTHTGLYLFHAMVILKLIFVMLIICFLPVCIEQFVFLSACQAFQEPEVMYKCQEISKNGIHVGSRVV